jgi:hypothetical protein
MLVDTAAYIEANEAKLSASDYQLLINNQKPAMQNVLLGYEAIGIAMAEQAVGGSVGSRMDSVAGGRQIGRSRNVTSSRH